MDSQCSRLEFPLAQGWCNGLTLAFEDTASSECLDLNQFIHAKQVHGNRIYEPSYSEILKGGALSLEADGLCFNSGQILDSKFGLLVKTADCIPLIYVHRTEPRVAVVHAGWRGLLQKIHLGVFEQWGFDPRDTWVWLGPSLNGKSFVVQEDMWSLFSQKSDSQIFETDPNLLAGQRYFYPWKLVENDFSKLGVELLYNVEVNTGDSKKFSSWRRCKSMGLSKIPQQNYSWIKLLK